MVMDDEHGQDNFDKGLLFAMAGKGWIAKIYSLPDPSAFCSNQIAVNHVLSFLLPITSRRKVS